MLHVVKNQTEKAVDAPQHLINPVEALWTIELVYGKHPSYTEDTYAVVFKTKLEGGASRCFLVIDLRDQFDEYLRDLNVFGSMEKAEFHRAIDYVRRLKIDGVFRRVPNLLSVMQGAAGTDESFELYDLVVDAVQSDPDAFPAVSGDGYKHGSSSGVILDTEQYVAKYGENAVAVTTEALLEILGLDEGAVRTSRFTEITRGWLANGLLLKKNRGPRLQDPIKPCAGSKDVRRFYVFRMDGLTRGE